MTTVINTPPATTDTTSSGISNIIITVLILGSLLFVGIYYVLPMIRNSQKPNPTPAGIKIEIPTPQPANETK